MIKIKTLKRIILIRIRANWHEFSSASVYDKAAYTLVKIVSNSFYILLTNFEVEMRTLKFSVFVLILIIKLDAFACETEADPLTQLHEYIECEIEKLPDNIITVIPQNRKYITESLKYFFKFLSTHEKDSFSVSADSKIVESIKVAKYLKANSFENWESNKIFVMPFERLGNYTNMPFTVSGMYMAPNLDGVIEHFAEYHFNYRLYNYTSPYIDSTPYTLDEGPLFYTNAYKRISRLPYFHKKAVSIMIQKLFEKVLGARHIIWVDNFYWETGNNIDRELLLLHELSHAIDHNSNPYHFWNESFNENSDMTSKIASYKNEALKIWKEESFRPEKILTKKYLHKGYRVPGIADRELMLYLLSKILFFNSIYLESETEVTAFKNEMRYLMSVHNLHDCDSVSRFYEEASKRHLIIIPTYKLFFDFPFPDEGLNSQLTYICRDSLLR